MSFYIIPLLIAALVLIIGFIIIKIMIRWCINYSILHFLFFENFSNASTKKVNKVYIWLKK